MNARRRARLLWRAGAVLVHLLRGAASVALHRLRFGPHWHATGPGERCIRRWMQRLCRIVGLEVRVHGAPAGGPALLVANHVSWMDVIALAATARTGFVAKAEVARWPFIGTLARGVGTLFIARAGSSVLNGALDAIRGRLAAGRRVTLFPEGTTSTGETVLPFRAALFEAARRAAVVVQPVALRYGAAAGPDRLAPFVGEDDLLAHLRRILPRRRTLLTIHFLPPLPATASRRVLAARAHAAIRERLEPRGVRAAA